MGTVFAAVMLFGISLSLFQETSGTESFDKIEGSYSLVSERDSEQLTRLMKLMGYKTEDIQAFQDHPTSENFQVKVLDSDKQKIEVISDTPKGNLSTILDKTKTECTLWDGRECTGSIYEVRFDHKKDKVSINMIVSIIVKEVFRCSNAHIFDETKAWILYHCIDLKGGLTVNILREFKRK